MDEIKDNILQIDGVKSVHDLHAWSLTVGTTALSAHVAIGMDNVHLILPIHACSVSYFPPTPTSQV